MLAPFMGNVRGTVHSRPSRCLRCVAASARRLQLQKLLNHELQLVQSARVELRAASWSQSRPDMSQPGHRFRAKSILCAKQNKNGVSRLPHKGCGPRSWRQRQQQQQRQRPTAPRHNRVHCAPRLNEPLPPSPSLPFLCGEARVLSEKRHPLGDWVGTGDWLQLTALRSFAFVSSFVCLSGSCCSFVSFGSLSRARIALSLSRLGQCLLACAIVTPPLAPWESHTLTATLWHVRLDSARRSAAHTPPTRRVASLRTVRRLSSAYFVFIAEWWKLCWWRLHTQCSALALTLTLTLTLTLSLSRFVSVSVCALHVATSAAFRLPLPAPFGVVVWPQAGRQLAKVVLNWNISILCLCVCIFCFCLFSCLLCVPLPPTPLHAYACFPAKSINNSIKTKFIYINLFIAFHANIFATFRIRFSTTSPAFLCCSLATRVGGES